MQNIKPALQANVWHTSNIQLWHSSHAFKIISGKLNFQSQLQYSNLIHCRNTQGLWYNVQSQLSPIQPAYMQVRIHFEWSVTCVSCDSFTACDQLQLASLIRNAIEFSWTWSDRDCCSWRLNWNWIECSLAVSVRGSFKRGSRTICENASHIYSFTQKTQSYQSKWRHNATEYRATVARCKSCCSDQPVWPDRHLIPQKTQHFNRIRVDASISNCARMMWRHVTWTQNKNNRKKCASVRW